AAPGSGYQIYNSLPGVTALTPTFLNVAFSTLAATQNTAAPGGPGVPTGAQLAALYASAGGAGGLATQLPLADPANSQGQQNDLSGTTTNSYAVFTHNQFNITDKLVLTLGARYSADDKKLNMNINSIFPGCGVLQANASAAASPLFYSPNPALPTATQN